jgi:sugar transferase (PEP-CTERM/EpsH1 system associated)
VKILWVKSGGLVPPDAGGKIRSLNLLKELALRHETTLFTFLGDRTESEHRQLERFFSSVICEPIELPSTRGLEEAFGYVKNLLTLQPYSMAKYCRSNVKRALRRLLQSEKFDVVICDFLFTAGAIPWDLHVPTVIFTHNVEEQIWRRHFQVTHNPIWKAVSWREYQTVGRAERRFLGYADEVLAVSENDKNHFSAYLDAAKITVIPTGVDVDFFRPVPETEQDNTIVFTGSMDWMPNDDAMFYFAEQILPHIRREIPEVKVFVVGRKPSPRLQARAAQQKNIQVTGTVDDIRPYVRNSAVYVAPLRIGGGTRIKIFEAMAMGKAILSTTIGAEGLPVQHEDNIVLADQPRDFAQQTVRLLRDHALRQRLGSAARTLVETNYSWASVAGQFDTVLQRVHSRMAGVNSGASRGDLAEGSAAITVR